MDSIILYSTHCPSCIQLEQMLKRKNIIFTENNDIDYMVNTKGFNAVPMLEVNGNVMNFQQAFKWVNEKKG